MIIRIPNKTFFTFRCDSIVIENGMSFYEIFSSSAKETCIVKNSINLIYHKTFPSCNFTSL